MTVECSSYPTGTVVKVAGRMDAESASEFEKACQECMAQGATRLAADLAGLQYVSSMGLRAFLTVAKTLQSKGGTLMLCGMKGMVKEVFDMTRLTPLFPLFESPEAALLSD